MESAKEVDISEVDSHGFYPARDESVYLNCPFWPYDECPIILDEEIDLQRAIDLAVEKKTVISFPCSISNEGFRKINVEWKGCSPYRANREDRRVCISLDSLRAELFG